MVVVEDRDREVVEDENKGRKKWLIPLLIALLILALLGWLLAHNSKDDTDDAAKTSSSQQTSDAQSSTNAAALKAKFNTQFNTQARTVYFNPDTTELQDEALTSTNLKAIADFDKNNTGIKLKVNGSIFDSNEDDSKSALAKSRANLIRQRLVDLGVAESEITVSTINNYEGQDDNARAEYARSVVISAE